MATESEAGGFSFQRDFQENRPMFTLGYHDSKRETPLSELQYGYLLNQDFSVATTPITNSNFKSRVFKIVSDHLATLRANGEKGTSIATASRADPILLPLTPEDTSMFPSQAVNTYIAYTSPWIDLCSNDPVVANISRQVLNLEVNYASWCGVKSIIITGPGRDASKDGGSQGLAQYSRAIQEVLTIAPSVSVLIHIPMYREPLAGAQDETLSSLNEQQVSKAVDGDVDIFTSWDSWNQIRSVCKYNPRLLVALKVPKVMAEKDLQNRWFCEPLHYLTLGPEVFQKNKAGYPSLTRNHQEMIFAYMRLKNAPWLLLCDVGPDVRHITDGQDEKPPLSDADFPSLEEARRPAFRVSTDSNAYCEYLRWLETQQAPFSVLETPILTNFQDWLQSPLQPLSDNLESATYEVFENDAIKYDQYELAIAEALKEWNELDLPTSKPGVIVMAVAGSGRGPIVTKAIQAAESTGSKVEVWALEKNPNAYVYLLRQNAQKWGGKVNVVKTDMRAWRGPLISDSPETGPVYGKIDILISELLGSFGDNELSPECLDGIQHVLAKPHGISIPQSYTAHLSPIATPKLYADIYSRAQTDATAFDTPWVVSLFSLDFVAQKVPGHPRFQEAWEFSHPIPDSTLDAVVARRSGGVVGGTGGSMAGAAGANDHNSRFCHLTFVARTRGVSHGLAGYFESTLYERKSGPSKGKKTEISIHPERIDEKSKDMVSWFPIFFPLKQPLYFPADTELEVSMWRQTDDTKVCSLHAVKGTPKHLRASPRSTAGKAVDPAPVPGNRAIGQSLKRKDYLLVPGPFPIPGGIRLWNRSLASCSCSNLSSPSASLRGSGDSNSAGAMASVRSALGGMPRKTALLSSYYYPSTPRNYLSLSSPLSSSLLRSSTETLASSPRFRQASAQRRHLATMSSQASHPALLIPGPIEFDDAVLQSMSHFSESHVGPTFVNTFGETLGLLRPLFQTTNSASQPFVISGSGTLGWDLVAANLTEAGEDALVLSTGYFGDSFADCLTTYGAKPTKLEGPVGGRPQVPEIEKALSEKKYKIVTVTHVDTSTGVVSDLKSIVQAVRKVSPETLVIVDGVCSVACEEIAFDEWDLDGVITASQKAIGCPAGLSISMFSGRAMEVFKNRKTPPTSYFASFKNWTPIMQNYEAKKPSYFATPSPQLVHALHTALKQILARPLSERFQRHKEVSDKVKKAVTDLGLEIVATKPEDQSCAMTAIYLPDGVQIANVLPKLANRGVIFAGGLHKEIATKYIRFGHMGVSVTDPARTDIDKALEALKTSLTECGYTKA